MRLLVVEDSALLRKMFGLAFPGQLHELAAGAVDFIDKTTFNVMASSTCGGRSWTG